MENWNIFRLNRRFLLAGFIPFLCVFAFTLLQTNAIFALDGMVNHTAVDWIDPGKSHSHEDHYDTCIDVPASFRSCHPFVKDGHFPWNSVIVALINTVITVGGIIGVLITLFIYDFLSIRFAFGISLIWAGIMNLLTPLFTVRGGYYSLLIFRFFTGLYTSILPPAVPVLMKKWFLNNELNPCPVGKKIYHLG